MARYDHLPIYKAAMDLTVYVETMVRTFSRYHKYTLGTDLRQQSREQGYGPTHLMCPEEAP